MVGISFKSSPGLWKRRAGSFCKRTSSRRTTGCGIPLSWSAGKGGMLMLVHYLGGRTLERCLADQHLPQRNAKGVEIGTDIQADSRKLLGTSELGCSCKCAGGCNRGFGTRRINRFCKSKVDDFHRYTGPFL